MKKVALALVLLAVIVGVGYLSSTRNSAKEQSRYKDGYSKGIAELGAARKEADSLRSVIQKHDLAYSDSLKSLAAQSSRQTDSLRQVVAGRDSLLASAKRRGPAATAKQIRAPAKAPVKADALTHAQILDYYKRRLGQLPADLSDYERKVAVNEIREETMRKFSISSADLDRLRQSSNVSE